MLSRFLTFFTICMLYGSTSAELYMSVDDIQRGMRGVGRTVFQGTRIDTFGVEVLGVLHNVFGPKSDMILARLSGGPMAQTGVIAGMSGSPVYIDERLKANSSAQSATVLVHSQKSQSRGSRQLAR